MGLIKRFLAVNPLTKATLILLLVAEIFNWLSMCMNDWALYDDSAANDKNKLGYGVWKRCGNQEPDPNCMDLDGWRLTWYGTFQGFAIIAFLAVNVAFFFIVLFMFVSSCVGRQEIERISAISCFVATVFYVVAIIIFGVKFDTTYDAGYDREILMSGFYLAIAVAVLCLAAGVCAVIASIGKQQIKPSGDKGGNEEQQQQEEQTSGSRNPIFAHGFYR
ncbi:uncharacterized protein LOC131931090 [Physella acuta]|uniref:uncharacterized protein LOC131931090 n=1 Tax=Physella acuta TaxID=109671 RepID=UPI0027DCA45F|nr:uncharacterized protein LOC131931090 [Physella acuta]